MPSRLSIDEQVYEAIKSSRNGVTFEFVTGGVRYKAVLQHKEAREQLAPTSSTFVASHDSHDSLESGKSALH